MNYLFGLFKYSTENVGDEIQSIAASRFLPRIDYYFDRDNLDATKVGGKNKVKIIMNGWYTHEPNNWPPKINSIDPLLISMHINQNMYNGEIAKRFLSKEGRCFLKKFGPVGARDLATLDFLQKNNVDSYFSGCVTLTLQKDKAIKKQDFILAVDVSDKIYETIKKQTSRQVILMNTNHIFNMDAKYKFTLAKYWLCLLQSARTVVTPRLHCILPCLAFNTPVLAISGRDPQRYAGLITLANNMSENQYLKNPQYYNLDNPPKNPTEYKKIRKDLEERCVKFTGFDSKNSFLGGQTYEEFIKSSEFAETITHLSETSYRIESKNYELLKQIKDLDNQIKVLENQILSITNPSIRRSFADFKKSLKNYVRKHL